MYIHIYTYKYIQIKGQVYIYKNVTRAVFKVVRL